MKRDIYIVGTKVTEMISITESAMINVKKNQITIYQSGNKCCLILTTI